MANPRKRVLRYTLVSPAAKYLRMRDVITNTFWIPVLYPFHGVAPVFRRILVDVALGYRHDLSHRAAERSMVKREISIDDNTDVIRREASAAFSTRRTRRKFYVVSGK